MLYIQENAGKEPTDPCDKPDKKPLNNPDDQEPKSDYNLKSQKTWFDKIVE